MMETNKRKGPWNLEPTKSLIYDFLLYSHKTLDINIGIFMIFRY